MPEKNDRRQNDFSRFDAMPTEELTAYLRLEKNQETGYQTSEDELLYILEVIEKRKAYTPPEKSPEEAFMEFQKYYAPDRADDLEEHNSEILKAEARKKAKHHWTCRMSAAVIFLAIILTSLTARAAGFDILGCFAKWTDSVFHFQSTDENVSFPDGEGNYTSLENAMISREIPLSILPGRIFDGYECTRFFIKESPVSDVLLAVFQKGKNEIQFQITEYVKSSLNLEKNEYLIEIYSKNRVLYYIFQNDIKTYITWMEDNYECSIWGDFSVQQAKEMIDSIEKR